MKKITFILIALIAGTTFAQDSNSHNATATVSADIVSPISISKTSDLIFGKVIADPVAEKIVVIDISGARANTTTANTINTSDISQAQFDITATENYYYSITLPAEVTLNGPSGTTMKVNNFEMNLSNGNNKASAGTDELNVGATLTVKAAQAIGHYEAADGLDVVVTYE
jgi:hypothetical protein